MSEGDWLAVRFEQNRPHLHAVACRMLGSAAEADDAVQEAWLRLSRYGGDGVRGLLAVLDPQVLLRADATALPAGAPARSTARSG